MSNEHDLVFTGSKNGSRERVEGQLFIAAAGNTYNAVSGSKTLLPLPNGAYIVKDLRFRDKSEMARNVPAIENEGGGICFPAWSVDLEPLFCSRRTLLRIHPDGNLPGTEGCIGIMESVNQCYDDLRNALSGKTQLILLVNHNNNNPLING